MLISLGQRHIQPGFEQAVEHLSQHKPYEENEGDAAVGPLLTFLELVHIGDLIQQMVDVFFNQEVVRPARNPLILGRYDRSHRLPQPCRQGKEIL
jgi:recyclin-1